MNRIILTEAEEALIIENRRKSQAVKYSIAGAFAAADQLRQLGRESCGGDGESKNTTTGLPWGESWFAAERAIRLWATTWKPSV